MQPGEEEGVSMQPGEEEGWVCSLGRRGMQPGEEGEYSLRSMCVCKVLGGGNGLLFKVVS